MLSDPVDDEDRFREIIDAAIESKEVKAFKKYTAETQRSKDARLQAARKEEQEARELAREMGVDESFVGGKGKAKGKDGEGDMATLQALILKRSAERTGGSDDFLARLEAKYAAPNKKKGRQGRKGNARDTASAAPDQAVHEKKRKLDDEANDEPPEEAFRAMSERATKSKRSKTRKSRKQILEDQYEVDEEAEREVAEESAMVEPPEEAFEAMAERAGKRLKNKKGEGSEARTKRPRRVAVKPVA